MTRALVCVLALASVAHAATPIAAAPPGLTVGVFLPTTLADGQQRFDFGEKLAAALGTALGQKATARNFARYADFADALKSGKLDVAVVDGWIAAESAESMPTVALGTIGGATKRRWVVVAKSGKGMAGVLGKALAVTRGAGSGNADSSFITNGVFDGAVIADKALKPTYAPSVESAIKMWSVGSADAVLVPAPFAPTDGKILYQSAPLPIAAVLVAKGRADAVKKALASVGAVAPFEGFTSAGADEIGALRRLLQNGPATRPPVWAEAAPVSLDVKAQVTFKGLAPAFPSLLDLVTLSKELPDD